MKKILLLLILFLTACSGDVEQKTRVPEPAPVEESFSATETPPLVDAPTFDKFSLWTSGTQLRGANIYQRRVYPELDGVEFIGSGAVGPPYIQADFDALADAGANYVNISAPGLFTIKPPYILDEAVQENLDTLLEMAKKADLFVVISARTGPGRSEFSILRDGVGEWFDEQYLVESIWEDEAAQEAWAEMWRHTAERYRDNPVVVGYDLMVEPNANEIVEIWEPDIFYERYGGTSYDWNFWFPTIVGTIRTVDRKTPILVGGMGYSSLGWLPSTRIVDDERMVYTFHQYEPFVYTHQDQGEVVNSYPGYFDANWDYEPEEVNREWLDDYFSIMDDFSAEYGMPIAANECGVIRWESGAANFMRDQLGLFEQRGINYALWMWYPAWEPLAEGDHDFNFRLGKKPDNRQDTQNNLLDIYEEFWGRNTIRPSNFLSLP